MSQVRTFSPRIQDVCEILNKMSLNEADREIYEQELKNLNDQQNQIEYEFEKGEAAGFDKGEAVGFDKGEAVGFDKGEAVGFDKGETVGFDKGKQQVALNLLNLNMDIETIVKSTGLSEEEIKKLKK